VDGTICYRWRETGLKDKRVLKDLNRGVDDALCEFKCGKDVGTVLLESVVIVA